MNSSPSELSGNVQLAPAKAFYLYFFYFLFFYFVFAQDFIFVVFISGSPCFRFLILICSLYISQTKFFLLCLFYTLEQYFKSSCLLSKGVLIFL